MRLYRLILKIFLVFLICFSQIERLVATEVTESSSKEKEQAREVFANIDMHKSYTVELSTVDMNNLPVGIERTISNVNYTIAVSNVQFFHEYAELEIWGRVTRSEERRVGKEC